MKNLVQSFYNWYRGSLRNPKYRWWIVLGTLGYLFSPIDIAPDFLPIVGWIDDAAITALLVSEVSQMFIDYVKLRQGQQPSEVSDYTTEVGKNVADPAVEVNAVSVE
jgi:uncharacterized membrane protein YkvA (DUF1232 family)